jgi:hypothetical protein
MVMVAASVVAAPGAGVTKLMLMWTFWQGAGWHNKVVCSALGKGL